MVRLWVLAWLLAGSSVWAQSVVFINPGRHNESYWFLASQAMQAAADSLGMQLEVRYAERDRLLPIAIAREIAARPRSEQPRFVVLTNDYGAAPEVLRILDAAGIDGFLAFNNVSGSARDEIGTPRSTYRHWLGSLEPVAEEAGYLTARALIEAGRRTTGMRAPDGKLQLLAIAGDRSTPSSIKRNEGMRRAVAEAGDVLLMQEVFGEWRRERALEQAHVLYQRYPQVRMVWAGNDEMAFGAMDAWRARGGKPGADMLFSAINLSPASLEARRRHELCALAGGHFLTGAWALVLLHDYAHGKDFASEGLELVRPMFVLLDELLIRRFEARIGVAGTRLDFRRFSKALNPQLERYAFESERLLR
ncbi:ABC transporter substrate-binding protein [Comamonas composti]|uniref:ABC transporter substrate-binding protein n=1 Tax=Comamonas composti TaxID=408558 RepID=UPI00047BD2DD|nr:ABC transporter substrate-binding protein [Comamonas composti]